jgi:hypothetical protein
MVKRNPIRKMHWLTKIKQILQQCIQIGLFIVLILLFVACTSQPPSDYYLEPIVSDRPGAQYNSLFLSQDKKMLFYQIASAVYTLNLQTMQRNQPQMLQNCNYTLLLTDVIVCEPDHENTLERPEPVLFEYPSFNLVALEQDIPQLTDVSSPVYDWSYRIAGKGLIEQGGRWYFIDLDSPKMVQAPVIRVQTYGQKETVVYSPDERHYFIFTDSKLSIYTSEDNTLQWETPTGSIDYVPGWIYDSCGLIYYNKNPWNMEGKVYPIYKLHVSCDSNQTPTP